MPTLLDLFCGAGGAAMGYARAGWDVVGVDIAPQPSYPFTFMQADALQILRGGAWRFDAIHASPPCQAYSRASRRVNKAGIHPDLIGPVRDLLVATGLPYVIENVVLAPLRADLVLCGSMFDIPVRRHRVFESNVPMPFPPASCSCRRGAVTGRLFNLHNTAQRRLFMEQHGFTSAIEAMRYAYGVPWMTWTAAQEAIPPAYTEFVGRALLAARTVAA